MSIIAPSEIVADYVIQVSTVFKPKTSNIMGSFHIWKKGGWFGSADELMKFCASPGCKGLFCDTFELPKQVLEEIGEDNVDDVSSWPERYQVLYESWFTSPVICSRCGNPGIREDLPDTYGFNMEADRISQRVAEFFSILEGSADMYLVRTREDSLFHKARSMLYSTDHKFDKYQETLEKARDRDCVFYPLKSIIDDTASGGDLARRFKSLLEA